VTGLEGTAHLIRLILRRDRVRLLLWVLALVGITYFTAGAVGTAYSTQKEIDAYADSLGSSPSAIAMAGPAVALHTTGGVVLFEASFTAVVGIALMSLFLVVRHTRSEEEEGRTELLRSAVVGRHAGSAAAVVVTVLASVLVGLGIAASVSSASVPGSDALLFGASVAALGVVFAAIALCLAQLFTHGRTTLGAGLAVLGVAYVLRAAGDVRGDWLVWLSPIGWSQATHPLGAARWWPLLVPLLASGLLIVAARSLAERRDVGAGLVASRPGPPAASGALGGPIGLALRLQRGSILGWSFGMFVMAAATGSLSREMQQMAKSNQQLEDYFKSTGAGSLVDSFFSSMLLILALAAAGFAVSSVLRLRSEEAAGRLEPLLATGLSRRRWLLGNLVVTAAGTVLVLLVSGLGLGLTYGLVVSDAGQPLRMAGLELVYAPAVLTLVGLAVLLDGWVPAWSKVVWAVLGVCFVFGWLGGLLDPPRWTEQLSPFTHTPLVPTEQVTAGAPTVIVLVAVLLTVLGLVGFRRRDIG
jgi:ABC-2 type transport system permease protein